MKKWLRMLQASLVLLATSTSASRAVELTPGDILQLGGNALYRVDPRSGDRSVVSARSIILGGVIFHIGAGPGFLDARGVAVGANGQIFVTDVDHKAVIRVDPATGDRTILSGCVSGDCSSPAGSGPIFGFLRRDIAAESDGSVVVVASSRIMRIDTETGDRVIVSGCSSLSHPCASDIGAGPELEQPTGLAVAPDGSYVVSNRNGLLGIDPLTGDRWWIASGFDSLGVGVSKTGAIYALLEGALIRVDPATGQWASVAWCADMNCSVIIGEGLFPDAIASAPVVDQRGAILMSDFGLDVLFRVDPETGDRTIVSSSEVGSGEPFQSILHGLTVVPSRAIGVKIDIKPGNDVDPINPMSRGVIPVAIFGSETFDVADVDTTTLAFGPAGGSLAHRNGPHRKDANHDRVKDLLAHFRTEESGIAFGDTEACVTGELLDGTPIEGCGEILTLGPCGLGFELALLLPPLMWLRQRRRRAPH